LSWNKSKNNLFDNYAESFLKKLVELEYKVILRTHPEATKRSQKTINRVRKNLQNYKNFEINTDISNLKPLSESSLLITDDGGIALEYYIIYKKPVLYINYLEKIHNLYFDKIKINTIEKEF
jgi:UDP-N-acetylglucosamine 2-epimerase